MGREKHRRRTLWERNPHCTYCGVITVLPETLPRYPTQHSKATPPNMATLDHLRSRLHPGRQERPAMLGEERTVLACYRCNNALGAAEQARLPLAELHERSQRRPQQ